MNVELKMHSGELEYICDLRKISNTSEKEFEINTIFKIIQAFRPRDVKIQIDDAFKKIDKLTFNPTISGPNILLKDCFGRAFSMWFKPVFYVPLQNTANPFVVDLIIFRDLNKSMYAFDIELQRKLYMYEFLSDAMLKDISAHLLSLLKTPLILASIKKEMNLENLKELIILKNAIKPKKTIIICESKISDELRKYIPAEIKI
ncbi:MAG: hypothetical protein QW097_00005, partial [archaeon]